MLALRIKLSLVFFLLPLSGFFLLNSCKNSSNSPGSANNNPGSAPANLTFAAAPKDMNAGINFTTSQIITVTNTGGAAANLSFNPLLLAPLQMSQNNCSGSNLATSGSCTFTVTFSPIAVISAKQTVTLNYSDASNNSNTYKLQADIKYKSLAEPHL